MAATPVMSPPSPGRVLVVDDDEAVREVYVRFLKHDGHHVVAAASGDEAVELFASQPFDCVVSDVMMPGMSGIELLRKIRAHDLDVPVIMATGSPALDTAVAAVDEGAARYLVKPFERALFANTVSQCVKLSRMARLKREALEALGGPDKLIGDRAGLSVRFDSALASLHMLYQPIVRLSDRSLYGYEALVRTQEPSIPHPGVLFDVAERLERIPDVSRKIRDVAPLPFAKAPQRGWLFINLHVHDLLDDRLYELATPLAALAPRVTLEITERAALDGVTDVRGRIERLRKMGFRIAVDDLGAGYAGLNSFAHLEPEVVKLDMTLVRGIETSATKQKLVRSMALLCREMGLDVVSEGIETKAELDCMVAMGCDLFQGYLFGKPGPAFVEPRFP